MNFSSGVIRIITSTLGANHPLRLGVAFALAAPLKMIVHALARFYAANAAWQALDEFSMIWYVLVAAALLFLPILVGRRGLSEEVNNQIETIAAMIEQAGMSGPQKKLLWTSLINKYLAETQPSISHRPSLPDLFEKVRQEEAERQPGTEVAP